jgi:hypothetical protein
MGQFKPMVKMMTTEPSVELKLKKGGVVKKADGGMMGALGGMPPAMPARGGMMPSKAPMRPPLAARRKAMAGKAMPAAMPAGVPAPASPMPAMKKGGKAEMESKSTHKAEMSKMKGLEKELKSHESKPASKAHKGLKTGGVVNGQGGFKAGGIINTENQGGAYRNTKMHDGSKTDHSPAKTGGVKMGNDGGYATGGVAKANGGGYKKGGSAKKAYATGGLVDTGKPVAMPQGRKKPSAPVSINQLSGTFKKGGQVKKAGGGSVSDTTNAPVDLSKGAYDKSIGPSEEDMDMAKAIRSVPRKLFRGAKSLLGIKDEPPKGSVTETQKSVTVTPAKKRGGAVKC